MWLACGVTELKARRCCTFIVYSLPGHAGILPARILSDLRNERVVIAPLFNSVTGVSQIFIITEIEYTAAQDFRLLVAGLKISYTQLQINKKLDYNNGRET